MGSSAHSVVQSIRTSVVHSFIDSPIPWFISLHFSPFYSIPLHYIPFISSIYFISFIFFINFISYNSSSIHPFHSCYSFHSFHSLPSFHLFLSFYPIRSFLSFHSIPFHLILTRSLTHSFNHSLIDLFTHVIHSPTYSDSLNPSCFHLFLPSLINIQPFIHSICTFTWFIKLLSHIESVIHSLFHSPTHSVTPSLFHLFNHVIHCNFAFTHSLLHLFVQWFIRSFVHSIVQFIHASHFVNSFSQLCNPKAFR